MYSYGSDEELLPVVSDKPARGREIISKRVPNDVFEAMRICSAKKSLPGENLAEDLEKRRSGEDDVYHEGYVEGKLFLVPDSTLRAMKDTINLKMRPRVSQHYRHETSFNISEYNQLHGRLQGLLKKLETLDTATETSVDSSDSSDESETTSSSEDSKTEKKETETEKPKSSSPPESEKPTDLLEETPLTEEPTTEEKTPVATTEEEKISEAAKEGETEEKISVEEETFFPETVSPVQSVISEAPIEEETEEFIQPKDSDLNEVRRRFIVSGHIRRNGQMPVFIVQECESEDSILKDRRSDYISSQSSQNFDIFVSGYFFEENILEEFKSKPVALKTKPDKIMIDENKSKRFDGKFKCTYGLNTYDLLLQGDFIKSSLTKTITPILAVNLSKNIHKKLVNHKSNTIINDNYGDHDHCGDGPVSIVQVLHKPVMRSPFTEHSSHLSRGGLEYQNVQRRRRF